VSEEKLVRTYETTTMTAKKAGGVVITLSCPFTARPKLY